MRLKTIALIAALTGGIASTASAMTVEKPTGVSTRSVVQHVDYKKDKYRHKRQKSHHGQKYHAGGRYDKAPSNWHRYNKRPGDWQRRGCVTVGPLWWCP